MQKVYLLLLAFTCLVWTAQSQNPTFVRLSFVPTSGSTIEATATDTGSGLVPDGPIPLVESTQYNLSISLQDANGDITSTITGNANAYQFFFIADGEVLDGPVTYLDSDGNSLPVGLATELTSSCVEAITSGTLRIGLRFFDSSPKSESSTIADGDEIFDITFNVTVEEDAEAPPCENEEEIITDVVLTWTPTEGGDAVVAMAQDPDGEGPLPLTISGPIDLLESTDYELSITLTNEIEGEDITEEIREEDDEHQFFFAFTDDLFSSPDGDGNVDNRDDPLNYNDFDDNNLPVGLSTDWTTECIDEAGVNGTFQVILKHQPDLKSPTTTAQDGGTDIDLTWTINILPDPDAPPCENEEEIITDVVLTWTPTEGGDAVVAMAQDPDGEGPLPLEVSGPINLLESTDYELSITLTNEIEMEDITEEIREEDDEHQFFFAFTDAVIRSPAGDGNIDNRDDPMNYNDFDENNLPVGLSTDWTTECIDESSVSGTFRVILKHQPDIKSPTSTANDGGTDIDITWDINVLQDDNAPPCENEEEIITDVVLTWTPDDGSATITAVAQDPDGEGPLPLEVSPFQLNENTTYTLAITLSNEIEMEDITEEIMEEDDEHQFFFAWTDGFFTNPPGDGNVDNRNDSVGYLDFDENNLPVGLSTTWTTGPQTTTGSFRVVLKHQPDIKSPTTTVEDGGTDFDLTFDFNLVTSVRSPLQPSEQLLLYPNPVTDQVQWSIEGQAVQPEKLLIFDQLGRLQFQLDRPTNLIQLGSLPVGTYTFLLQSAEGSWVQRFVKTR